VVKWIAALHHLSADIAGVTPSELGVLLDRRPARLLTPDPFSEYSDGYRTGCAYSPLTVTIQQLRPYGSVQEKDYE